MSLLNAAHLGPTAYREGLRIQEALVAALAGEPGRPGGNDWLLYPDHPPVLTVGRSPSEGNLRVPRETLAERGIEVFEVARGGDITWHGPGQLVGYTICDLDHLGHDLHRFLRDLEQGLLDALAGWGIEGRRVPGRTGIWVGDDKIASIGVAVRRWVTYHGFALNVCSDPSGFELIHPCGLHGIRMTTVARLLGEKAPSLEEARRVAAETVALRLGYAGAAWKPAEDAWNAAGLLAGPELKETRRGHAFRSGQPQAERDHRRAG
jgi:lipoate-protein ligase B